MERKGFLRVLVIEDDESIRGFVADELVRAGHLADGVPCGQDGIDRGRIGAYDAAIVDLTLPDIDGFQVVRTLRELRPALAILVLSARDAVRDRVTGLTLGADDYVGKPFHMSELLARLEAVTRRTGGQPDAQQYEAGGVSVDLSAREVRRDGIRIELSKRELDLLAHLMRSAGRPLSKNYLLERLWHAGFDPGTNVVDVLVCRLRNKLDRGFTQRLIHTVRGVGYVFRAGES